MKMSEINAREMICAVEKVHNLKLEQHGHGPIQGGLDLNDLHLVIEAARAWAKTQDASRDVRAKAFTECEAEARRYAAMYEPHSDGRNTFIIFADWCEQHALIDKPNTEPSAPSQDAGESVDDWINDIVEMARDQRHDGSFELTASEVIGNAKIGIPGALARANPTPSQVIAAVEEMRERYAEGETKWSGGIACGWQKIAADEILAKLRAIPHPEPDEVSEAEVEPVAQAIYLSMFPERDAKDWAEEAQREGGRLRDCYMITARAALEAARAAKRGAR